jgi:hypothetical protein
MAVHEMRVHGVEMCLQTLSGRGETCRMDGMLLVMTDPTSSDTDTR